MYWWEGKICTDTEVLLMVKTKSVMVKDLIDKVKKEHPYQVPELITFPLNNGNPSYLKWLDESTK